MTQPAGQTGGVPDADVAIDEPLVARLLESQHPDLASLPLARFTEGWDNVSFRLGDALLVRLPRRAMAAPLVWKEQQWLPLLAPVLPVPIPAPVRVGMPSESYPWSWSIVPFFPGEPVDRSPLSKSGAGELGAFLRALHRHPVPPDPPHNPYRGVALASRRASFEERAAALRASGLLPEFCDRLWQEALAAPIDEAPVWLHGDLHPGNVLARDGRLRAVIDWGDVCVGDPATDLGGLWLLLSDHAEIERALAAYAAISTATLARAKGWSVFFAVMHLASGAVNAPRHAQIGSAALARLAGIEEQAEIRFQR